jgi:hypothetical protein
MMYTCIMRYCCDSSRRAAGLQCLNSTAPVTQQAATYHPRADITSTSYNQSLLLLCVILHCCLSHLGCRHICQRNELELHLVRGCQFNKEPSQATYTQVDTSQYEVMCPNAVLGCDVSCSRKDLQAHLEGACKFCGPGPKEAMAERARDLQVRWRVTLQCILHTLNCGRLIQVDCSSTATQMLVCAESCCYCIERAV